MVHIFYTVEEAEDELPTHTSRWAAEAIIEKHGLNKITTQAQRFQVLFSIHLDCESEEEFPKEASTITTRPHTGFSLRTEASPRNCESSQRPLYHLNLL